MRNFKAGLLVVAVILCALWIQINVLNSIPLWGAKANIGIILVVSLSILCGQSIGMTVGIVYGIFSDILFGKAFGVYTLLFFAIGFACGIFSNRFSKDNKMGIILVVVGTTILFEIGSYCLFVLCYDYAIEFGSSMIKILAEGLYHVILTRLLFRFLTVFSEMINRGKSSYYLL